MDFKFTFEGDNAVQKAVAFKTFVEEQRVSGVKDLKIEQSVGQAGDQGIGKFLGSMVASIANNSETIKSIIGVLSHFMELFDGRLIIEDGKGKKLVIPGGKQLTPEQKENIAIQFTKN